MTERLLSRHLPPWRRFRDVFCAGLCLAGLSACAPLPTVPSSVTDTAWRAHADALSRLSTWSAHGRIAIQTGNDGFSATVRWQQDHEHYNLRIMAPMGQGTFELRGDPHQATLTTPQGEIIQARSADDLMRRHLDRSLPVEGLRYWILGLPVPGAKITNINLSDQGRILDLQQLGWRISVLRYTNAGAAGVDAPPLPSKLFLLRDRLKIRIAITDWQAADRVAGRIDQQ